MKQLDLSQFWLWIIFYSYVSLLMLCGVRFFLSLGFSGWCRVQCLSFFAWRNWLGNYSSNVRNMVLVCLMWLVWKERNARIFENVEQPIDLLKTSLGRTLFEWSCIWGLTHCISLSDFIISVRFSIWFDCIFCIVVSLQ